MQQGGMRLMCKANVGSCNVYKYGEQFKFGMYLEKAYGKGTAETLQQKSREITKFSDIRIKEMIEYYNELITNLQ